MKPKYIEDREKRFPSECKLDQKSSVQLSLLKFLQFPLTSSVLGESKGLSHRLF
jgi:hypothetical protein